MSTGNRTCSTFLRNITASANNTIYTTPEPLNNQAMLAQTYIAASATAPFATPSSNGTRIVNGTYEIYMQYCEPSGGATKPSVLQTIHGIVGTAGYWDIAPGGNDSYSFVKAATDAGYAVLSFDRLSVGNSSKPDGIQDVQIGLEIDIAINIAQSLRNNTLGLNRTFSSVVGVGHSFGSAQLVGAAGVSPTVFDGLVLTGFAANSTTEPLSSLLTFQNTIANTVANSTAGSTHDADWSALPNSYLITQSQAADQLAFFSYPNYTQAALDLFTSTKGTYTMGELMSMSNIALPLLYTGPVQVVTGARDAPFCATNCYDVSSNYTSKLETAKALFPMVNSTDFATFVVNVVSNFSPTCAAWLFDRPGTAEGRTALSADHLQRSLQKTLESYPQWFGQLQLVDYDPVAAKRDHTRRLHRVELVWASPADPGIEFVVSESKDTIVSHVPSVEERSGGAGGGAWDAGNVQHLGLLPTVPVTALADQKTSEGLPCVIVQVTSFACGGVAVAVKMSHSIADAQTLLRLMDDWGHTNIALSSQLPLPILTPLFDPSQVDVSAAGDVDAEQPSADILESSTFPAHRFDWWASQPGYPAKRPIPPELDPKSISMGKPIPWSEFDWTLPTSHYMVYFNPKEIQQMWEAASPDGVRISRLDALLAHSWRLIIRARGLSNDSDPVHLDLSLGVRTRLEPPLSPFTLGSPIINVPATAPASVVAAGGTAAVVRSATATATDDSVRAFLHERAFAESSQRYWDCFLGERHTIVTSWLQVGMHDVSFADGVWPTFASALLGDADGLLQIVEAGGKEEKTGGKCYEEDVHARFSTTDEHRAVVTWLQLQQS
ncbi:hypothetical protein RQP46_008493 [Phenoliferia psychrophenolica]